MITKSESKAFGAKKFQEMDANGDGQLSSEEMKASYKKMMSEKSTKETLINSKFRGISRVTN
ncbi:EF-hand domain-containing protein [Candidatus Nitrotoga arctica]